MAHIANRSRFRVTVKNKQELARHCVFNRVPEVEACMTELRPQRFTPRVVQLDESCLVHIRDKGHKPLEATYDSEGCLSIRDGTEFARSTPFAQDCRFSGMAH